MPIETGRDCGRRNGAASLSASVSASHVADNTYNALLKGDEEGNLYANIVYRDGWLILCIDNFAKADALCMHPS